MKHTKKYKSIFMYASLQFCGHIDEYFIKRSEKLVVYLVMPRVKNKKNLLRIYRNGILVEERQVWTSENIFLYYLSWYIHYLYFIFSLFSAKEKFFVISYHPITFIGMTLQRIFRKITYVYWVGDYFPPMNRYLLVFEKIKKFYHDKADACYYLSDSINRKINGTVKNDDTHKTVMWGTKAQRIKAKLHKNHLNLLFVGLIKKGQGLETLFEFLSKHKEFTLKIIGVCDKQLFASYKKDISLKGISRQVFFPNKFYSDSALMQIAKDCHVGLALYDIGPTSSAYYTDPGKVKSYAEMNLPIIMSNMSSIVSYIQKYHAGEVIDQKPNSLLHAIIKVQKNYSRYQKGIKDFNAYFSYESYYDKAFTSMSLI